ncbi:hypothetical protein pb186bvf_006327 [Paramecium bursaria]
MQRIQIYVDYSFIILLNQRFLYQSLILLIYMLDLLQQYNI